MDKTFIINNKIEYIEEYKRTWKRDICLEKIPSKINENNIGNILRVAIRTGYGIITSCMVYCYTNKNKIVRLKNINIPKYMTYPRDFKLKAKEDELLKTGKYKPIIVNSNLELLDGYATLLVLKQLGEEYIIVIKDDTHKAKREKGIKELRNYLYEKQNGLCYICCRPVIMDTTYEKEDNFATVDHMLPLSKGGKTNSNNCRLCCKICNSLKSDIEFSERLRQNIIQELHYRKVI